MKKKSLLLLFAASLFAGTMSAQVDNTLQFVDAEGNVIPDGSTVNGVYELIENPFAGDTHIVNSGLYVKNNSAESVGCNVSGAVLGISNGHLDCCFPSVCFNQKAVGEFETQKGTIEANEVKAFTAEWYPDDYGQCQATFQLRLYEVVTNAWGVPTGFNFIANGPSVTVNFNYDETSAGISDVEIGGDNRIIGRYTIDGRALSAPRKGINIVKYENGRTAKIIVK